MALLAQTAVTNTEFDMELALIERILQGLHAEKKGWKQLMGCRLDDIDIDFVFFLKGQLPVAAMVMETAYVQQEDLKLAAHLRDLYRHRMNGRELHVMLVYRQLLIRPQRLVKGISLLSISEEFDTESSIVLN